MLKEVKRNLFRSYSEVIRKALKEVKEVREVREVKESALRRLVLVPLG